MLRKLCISIACQSYLANTYRFFPHHRCCYSSLLQPEFEKSPDLEQQALKDNKYLRKYLVSKVNQFGFVSADVLSSLRNGLKKNETYSPTAATYLIQHYGRNCAELEPTDRQQIATDIFNRIKTRLKSINVHNAYLQCRLENCDAFSPSVVQEKITMNKRTLTRNSLLQFLGQYSLDGNLEAVYHVIDELKNCDFEIPPIGWGYLAYAHCVSDDVEKCLEIVNQIQLQNSDNWHFYCLVCSGLVKAGSALKAVDLFCDASHKINDVVPIIPFVQMLETMLNEGALDKGLRVVSSMATVEPQMLMHATHHLTRCPNGIQVLRLMQKNVSGQIVGIEREVLNTAGSIVWQCLEVCENFDELLTDLTLTQNVFVDIPVMDLAVEMALTKSPEMAKNFLLIFAKNGKIKPHYVLPLLFGNMGAAIYGASVKFVFSLSLPRLLQEIENFLAFHINKEPHWWLSYLFLVQHQRYSQAQEILHSAKTMPQMETIMDCLASPQLREVLFENSLAIVEQCRQVKTFPIQNLLKIAICELCNRGNIATACDHATDLYSITGQLDLDIQSSLFLGSIKYDCPLSSNISSLLSDDFHYLNEHLQRHDAEAVITKLNVLLHETELVDDRFIKVIADKFPKKQYLQLVTLTENHLPLPQYLVFRKQVLCNLFESNPADALSFVSGLRFPKKKIKHWISLLFDFVKICVEKDYDNLLRNMLGFLQDDKMSARLLAYQAYVDLKADKWTIPSTGNSRESHLILFHLAQIVSTKGDSNLVTQFISQAEKQKVSGLLELVLAKLIVVGCTDEMGSIIKSKLTEKQIFRLALITYRSLSHSQEANTLIGIDKTMRPILGDHPEWKILLNFYFCRQTLYLISQNPDCLDSVLDYFVTHCYKSNTLNNFEETEHFFELLNDAKSNSNFTKVTEEVKKLQLQRQSGKDF